MTEPEQFLPVALGLGWNDRGTYAWENTGGVSEQRSMPAVADTLWQP